MAEKMNFSSDDSNHPKSSKRTKTLKDEDRISNLPEFLILQILSFLPSTKEAIRTSILSINWQHHWTSVPVLDFDDRRDIIPNHSSFKKNMKKFALCVTRTMLLNQSLRFEKFRLGIGYGKPLASDVGVWLRLLITRKHVDNLDLEFYDYNPSSSSSGYNSDDSSSDSDSDSSDSDSDSSDSDSDNSDHRDYSDSGSSDSEKEPAAARYRLPMSMFRNNSSLLTLRLTNCDINRGKHISCKSLVVLYLCTISLHDGLIEEMLLGCGSLRVLELRNCWNYKSLDIQSEILRKIVINSSDVLNNELPARINAPHLQSLAISGCLYEYSVINSSSLVDAELNLCVCRNHNIPMISREHRKIWTELFQNFRHVKDLTVGSGCLQVLSKLGKKFRFYSLSRAICLTLDTSLDEKELPGLTRLLRYHPHMEKLIINMTTCKPSIWKVTKSSKSDDHDGDNNYWSSPKKSFASALKNLKTIRVIGFGTTESEAELLFFLLKKSRKLKKMTIHARNATTVSLKNSLSVAQRLLNFPRCSKNAIIAF